MNLVFIMRGIPGSGKSTVAKKLVEGGVIHSTDDLRMVNGTYVFDPKTSGKMHAKNFELFCESLAKGISPVICDNTNVRRGEYSRYIEAAQKAGYLVAVVSLPHPLAEVAAARNTHGVPLHAIEKMIKDWEP